MQERKANRIITKMMVGLLLGCLSWVAMVINAAHHMRVLSLDHYRMAFGPLDLGAFSKHAMTNGDTSISLRLTGGLLAYIVAWILVGLAWAFIEKWWNRDQP